MTETETKLTTMISSTATTTTTSDQRKLKKARLKGTLGS